MSKDHDQGGRALIKRGMVNHVLVGVTLYACRKSYFQLSIPQRKIITSELQRQFIEL